MAQEEPEICDVATPFTTKMRKCYNKVQYHKIWKEFVVACVSCNAPVGDNRTCKKPIRSTCITNKDFGSPGSMKIITVGKKNPNKIK